MMLFFRDRDDIVHQTGGHYGAQSMMACEGVFRAKFEERELSVAEGPTTCLACVAAMTFTTWR